MDRDEFTATLDPLQAGDAEEPQAAEEREGGAATEAEPDAEADGPAGADGPADVAPAEVGNCSGGPDRQGEDIPTAAESRPCAAEPLAVAPPNGGEGVADEYRAMPPQYTDLGNAQRLSEQEGGNLRWVWTWEDWLVWEGVRWRPDHVVEVRRRAGRVIKGLRQLALRQFAEAKEMPEDDPARAATMAVAKANLAHAKKSESRSALNAMCDLLRDRPGIKIGHDQLDRHPWLLACPNGAVDLQTGRLRAGDRRDYLTQLCPTEYDPGAACPLWEATLLKIFAGDREMVAYFQRLAGYCITGSVREQILPVLWGSGSNGKSLAISTLLKVLGEEYAGTGTRDLAMAANQQDHPTGLADLFGKRLVALLETAEGGRLNESRIKALTGGDKVKARHCREDYWAFNPTHKIWLATNHRPEVRGTDHGIWRRLRLIPFTVTFWDPARGEDGPEELRADKSLGEGRLEDESRGILAWAVRGCLDWLRGGLREPPGVLAATAQYRGEQNIVEQFIGEACVRGEGLRARAGDLHTTYTRWHEGRRESGKPLSTRAFAEAVEQLGINKARANGIWYLGIALNADSGDTPHGGYE